ncbi:SGNH hydrolase domain-containing protein [Prosthecochloris sp. CIB 2401]|uniref:SGNH hydrolase domain-containing protein n=1 Tax=Prosthecochloris sp. CIB 2401 TaxID=1868325 RepID=UPI00080A9C49|nr:SGNH hydrolase domain-containing protein [Prosthecochloris sp. CIB 2401]ANT64620.1 hypothetical protein Ptc2401_00833 [Prosthecochloris sp. CIB 2401]
MAFAKYLMFRPFSGYDSAGIIFASLAISTLSWKYIEQPFRGKRMVLPERKRLFAFAGVVMVVAVGTGGVMHLQNGILPWTRQCAPDIRFKGLVSNSPDKPILIGDTAKAGSFVVWGDSHAGSLAPALQVSGLDNGVSGYVFSAGSTLPILSVERYQSGFDEKQFNKGVYSFIRKNMIKNVFLVGAWSHYIKGKGVLLIEGNKELTSESRFERICDELNKTVELLKKEGVHVYVVLDVPAFNTNPIRFVCLEKRYPGVHYFSAWRDGFTFTADYQQFNPMFNAYALREFENVLQPISSEGEGRCTDIIVNGGTVNYRDSNHLSFAGAAAVSSVFDEALKNNE